MLLNVVLEKVHSKFMIQHCVCDGGALRNKPGDRDSQRKTSGLDLNKVQNYLRMAEIASPKRSEDNIKILD